MMKKNMKLNKLIALAVLMGGVTCSSSVWAAGTVIKIGATATDPSTYSTTAGVGVDASSTSRTLGSDVAKIQTGTGDTPSALSIVAGICGIRTEKNTSFNVTASSIVDGIDVRSDNSNVWGISLASSGTNEILDLGGINAKEGGDGIAKGIEATLGTNTITFKGGTRFINVESTGISKKYGIYLTNGTNYIGTDADSTTGHELGSITVGGTGSASAYGIVAGGGANTIAFIGSGSLVTATSSSDAYGIGFLNIGGKGGGAAPANGTTTIKGLGSVTATSTVSGTAYGIYVKNGNDPTGSDKFSVSFAASGGTVNAYSVGGDNFGVKFDEKSGGTTGKSEVLNVKTIVAGVDPSDNTGNTISSGAAYGIQAKAGVNKVDFTGEGSSVTAKSESFAYGIHLSGGTNYIGKDNKGLGSITAEVDAMAGSNHSVYGICVEGGDNEITFAGTGSSVTANTDNGNSYGISYGSSNTAVTGTTKITGLGSIVSDPLTDGKYAYGINVNNGNSAGASDPVTFTVEFVNNTVATDGVIKAYSANGDNYGIMFNDNFGGDNGKSEVLNVKTITAGVDPTDNTKITSGKSCGINALDGTNTVTFIGGTSSSIVAKSSGNADVYGIYLQNGINYIGTDVSNIAGKELGCITVVVTGNYTAYGIEVYDGSNSVKFAGAGSSITAKSSGDSVGINLAGGITAISGLGGITTETTGSNTAYGIITAGGTNNITFVGTASSITAKSNDSEAKGIYSVGGENTIQNIGSIDVCGTGNAKCICIDDGETTVTFSGSTSFITAKSSSGAAYGISLGDGTSNISGLAAITSTQTGSGDAYGIYAENSGSNTVSFKGNDGQAIATNSDGTTYSIYVQNDSSTTVNFEDSILSGKIKQKDTATLEMNFNNGGVWTPKTDDVTGTVIVNVNSGGSIIFDLPATISAGDILLQMNGTVAINNGSTIRVINGKATALNEGDEICLIDNNAIITLGSNVTKQHSSDGITWSDAEIYLKATDNTQLMYKKTKMGLDPDGSKAPVEGVAAAAAAVNTSTDLSLGAGLDSLLTRTAEISNTETFGAANFGKAKLKTGSHVDTKGYGIMVGVGKKVFDKAGNKTTGGLYFEYGNNDFDTYNNAVTGDGKNIYKGVGYMMRWDNKKSGNYYEGMLHTGKVKTQWSKNGSTDSYEIEPNYFGGAVTYGHKFMLDEEKQFSVYGSYVYTHIGGADAKVGSYDYSFDSTNSHRTKVGVRYAVSDLMDTRKVRPYVGLAWEHEFNGEAGASVARYGKTATPSMKGNTGILEFGCKQEVGKWTLGIGAELFTGKRKGCNGTLQAVYNF